MISPGDRPVPAEADLLIVGSGVSGAVAALTAHARGLRPVVIEKTALIGGNSAMSGGLLWVPNNPLQREEGVPDSAELSRAYLDAVLGDPTPPSSVARREAFLSHGPKMLTFLRTQGLDLRRCTGYSDYYPEHPGGLAQGRSVRMATFDLNRLGPWRPLLRRRNLFPGVPIHMEEVAAANVVTRTRAGVTTVGRIAGRALGGRLRGRRPDGLGAGLMGSLLHALVQRDIPVHTEVALTELVHDGTAVTGAALALPDGTAATIRCGAVLLASGGFSHNDVMRKQYGPAPASTAWTLAGPGDMGDGILAGQAVGGAVDLMDEAIWMGTSVRPDGTREMHLYDRCLPHSIVVDSSGQRFVNESVDYARFGQALYHRNRSVPSIPAWLVLDSRHRRRYGLGDMIAGLTPRTLIRQGYLRRSETLEGLATACGIDPPGLRTTVSRFNDMAVRGVDEDFHRGDSAYDRYLADPRTVPNPALGTIEAAPFYAVPCYPGDVGTTGGLVTDSNARVLDTSGSVIPGLYAAGTCAATVMGHTYPGPGASISTGATFGYIAAHHCRAGH
ncbi:FAD-dependent oxidoreductase [Pseudonocardia spinosispora]|uniref:FAD-dependent oxidoreductase n=1 Tax=Pseudonocardia spinosispora TaxID=103441 RepID=UPI0003FF68B2|nr:FAD-dependent oxidoreductase [Pseudonocardia spinosispora]